MVDSGDGGRRSRTFRPLFITGERDVHIDVFALETNTAFLAEISRPDNAPSWCGFAHRHGGRGGQCLKCEPYATHPNRPQTCCCRCHGRESAGYDREGHFATASSAGGDSVDAVLYEADYPAQAIDEAEGRATPSARMRAGRTGAVRVSRVTRTEGGWAGSATASAIRVTKQLRKPNTPRDVREGRTSQSKPPMDGGQ